MDVYGTEILKKNYEIQRNFNKIGMHVSKSNDLPDNCPTPIKGGKKPN